MASGAMILRGLMGVMANIALQITLMGTMGIRIHLFCLDGNFRVIAVAGQAGGSRDWFAWRILLMTALAFNPDLFVFFRQKLVFRRTYGKSGND